MYNKVFTKILDSSIWMEALPTRIVWLTFLAAMDEDGFVAFASPANVAHRAIVPLEDTLKALAVLEGPDQNSSDPEYEGRRIEKVPGGWIILNAPKYRRLVTKAVIQENTRTRVRAHREKQKPCNAPSVTVTHCNAENVTVTKCNGQPENVTPSRAIAEAEAVSERDIEGEAKSGRFAPPTLEEVRAYCQERGNKVDPVRFCNHYEANGWMRGKTKIRSWKACVRTWEVDHASRRAYEAQEAQYRKPETDLSSEPFTQEQLDAIALANADRQRADQ